MVPHVIDAAELGSIIRFHRKQAHLTRARLSELSGVGSTVIYELERGKQTVQFNVILKICSVLNLRIAIDGPLMEKYERREKG